MTEEDWQSDPLVIEECIGDIIDLSDRKIRLFLCACVRQVWPLLIDARGRRAIEVAERFADGLANRAQLDRAWTEAWEVGYLGAGGPADRAAASAASLPLLPVAHAGHVTDAVRRAFVLEASRLGVLGLGVATDPAQAGKSAQRRMEAIFRDIVGNPFRSVAVQPAWLTWQDGLVSRLAETIYQERRFSDLPVLGDALDEAGCDIEEILNHCHGPGPHVLGCWVVDHILSRR